MTTRILIGDALSRLRELPDESVHCAVTSPPYYNLRDFGTEPLIWDGDPGCDHDFYFSVVPRERHSGDGLGGRQAKAQEMHADRGLCQKCGAWCGQLGLEPTPDLYIAHLVQIFRELRRVLRSDGTLWLNIGDSYAGSSMSGGAHGLNGSTRRKARMFSGYKRGNTVDSKPKDLLMIPALLALALRADGWYLRSEIVWAKTIPIPESVKDRPTSAHEKIFLLSKSPNYYFDQYAVKEKASTERAARPVDLSRHGYNQSYPGGRYSPGVRLVGDGRSHNIRNVWHLDISTFPEAHFATFSPDLPRRCIMAGTSERGVCEKCGAPWQRLLEKSYTGVRAVGSDTKSALGVNHRANVLGNKLIGVVFETSGWQPSCSCNRSDPIPATVLDPFGGAGTTGMVAHQLRRHAILIELKSDYAVMSERRMKADAGFFANVQIVA